MSAAVLALTLARYEHSAVLTRGLLLDSDGHLLAYTLEDPDPTWMAEHADAPRCIPHGVYPLRARHAGRWPGILARRFGAAFGTAIEVADVPGREAILIHPGNRTADTRGCILPGLGVDGDAVTSSRAAWRRIAGRVLPALERGEVRLRVALFAVADGPRQPGGPSAVAGREAS